MLSVINLVYVLPVVIALIVAGALVNPRVSGGARTLMWTGIALTCLSRLAGAFLPYLVLSRNLTQLYTVLNVLNAVVSAIGAVLLVVAVGAAARGARPSSSHGETPGQPAWPSGQYQPGQPPQGGFTPPPAQPGQWTPPGQWSNQG